MIGQLQPFGAKNFDSSGQTHLPSWLLLTFVTCAIKKSFKSSQTSIFLFILCSLWSDLNNYTQFCAMWQCAIRHILDNVLYLWAVTQSLKERVTCHLSCHLSCQLCPSLYWSDTDCIAGRQPERVLPAGRCLGPGPGQGRVRGVPEPGGRSPALCPSLPGRSE